MRTKVVAVTAMSLAFTYTIGWVLPPSRRSWRCRRDLGVGGVVRAALSNRTEVGLASGHGIATPP